MSAFTFYSNIPAASENPSVSQSKILQNFTSLGAASPAQSWVNQDHFGFGTGTDGQHTVIRFPVVQSTLSPAGAASEMRTVVGLADSSKAQAVFTNSGGTFPLSAMRAFGTCAGNGATGAVSLANGYGIASITRNDINKITTVNLTPGVVLGTNYCVLASTTQAISGTSTDQVLITYTITSATSFTMTTVNVANNVVVSTGSISFVVLQF